MLYLATSPHEPAVADLLGRRRIGLMSQPASNVPQPGWIWAADNGRFSANRIAEWDGDRWMRWLDQRVTRSGCLFATVPDEVGNCWATLDLFDEWVSTVKDLRYPVAFVAQDGQLSEDVPWRECDAVFIGGTTEWKMGEEAFGIAEEGRARGKWVHVGRVNGWPRFKAWAAHADSADGTILAFGPSTNLPRVVTWIERHDANPQLWESVPT